MARASLRWRKLSLGWPRHQSMWKGIMKSASVSAIASSHCALINSESAIVVTPYLSREAISGHQRASSSSSSRSLSRRGIQSAAAVGGEACSGSTREMASSTREMARR